MAQEVENGESDAQLWEVVARSGAVVRKFREIHSKELGRLSSGAWLEEIGLVGDRLHYKKLRGDGPDFGWVSVAIKGARLLARRSSLEPAQPLEGEAQQGSAAETKLGRSHEEEKQGAPGPTPEGEQAPREGLEGLEVCVPKESPQEEVPQESNEGEAARDPRQEQIAWLREVGHLVHLLDPTWSPEIVVHITERLRNGGVVGFNELQNYVFANHLGLRLQQVDLVGIREQLLNWRELLFRVLYTDCTTPPPPHLGPTLQVLYVLKMLQPTWSIDDVLLAQCALESGFRVNNLPELLAIGEWVQGSELECLKESLERLNTQVQPSGVDAWQAPGLVQNVSGKWSARKPDSGTIFSFEFNQVPGSESFSGPVVNSGRVKADFVEWKVAWHGCSGCMGRLQGDEIWNMVFLADNGFVLDTYTCFREPGSQERCSVTPLAGIDTAEAMLRGPPPLSLPPPVAGKVAVVRTAAHMGERLQLLPAVRLEPASSIASSGCALSLEPTVCFQELLGFGSSFSQTASDLLDQLGLTNQERVLDLCFGPAGLGYGLARLPMTSCDFSTGLFTCCDEVDDLELASFSIARYTTLFAMLRRATASAGRPLKLIGSPWSPPVWMKENASMVQGGRLRPECRGAWAQYYVRFARELEAAGLPLWAVTVQNEPGGKMRWESCVYSAEEERDFVREHLGPALSALDVKLLVWDHNRDGMFERAQVVYSDPEAAAYVWGLGFHWYGDPRFETWPVQPQVCFENVARVHELRPEKHLIMTEACQENGPHLGEWRVAERYAMNIIEDLNHWTEGWIDWNLLLDERGGPNHTDNYCSAPIIVDAAGDLAYFQPSYYYIAHFSRFIRPGARRVLCALNCDVLQATAFANPDGTLAVVMLNQRDLWVDLTIKLDGQGIQTGVPAHSITTLIFPFEAEAQVEETRASASKATGDQAELAELFDEAEASAEAKAAKSRTAATEGGTEGDSEEGAQSESVVATTEGEGSSR